MIDSSVKNLGEVEYDNQGRIKGVGGPRLVSRRGPPLETRSARAKSAGGPGARISAPGPAGGENFAFLSASMA